LQEQTIMDGKGSLDGFGHWIFKTDTGCKAKKGLFKRFQTTGLAGRGTASSSEADM
jgi:hypothetical protein